MHDDLNYVCEVKHVTLSFDFEDSLQTDDACQRYLRT